MKKNQKTKRRAITLIEMIVVMLLIATITGALAYNYNASLNEGKVFKTKEGMARIKTILSMKLAETDKSPQEIADGWESWVKESPLAGKSGDLLRDGWGKPYRVSCKSDGGDEFEVESEGLNAYNAKKAGH